MTSAVSAEYGRFSGGVVNTITKSGGNTFSGSFRSTLSNDAWRSTSAYRTAAGRQPAGRDVPPEGPPDLRGDSRRADLQGHALVLRRRPLPGPDDLEPDHLHEHRLRAPDHREALRGQADLLAVPEPHDHGLVHRHRHDAEQLHAVHDVRPREPLEPAAPAVPPRRELQRRPHGLVLRRGPVLEAEVLLRELGLAVLGPPPGNAGRRPGPRPADELRLLLRPLLARRNATTTTTSSRGRTSSPRSRSARTTSWAATTTSAGSGTRTTTSPEATGSSTRRPPRSSRDGKAYPVIDPNGEVDFWPIFGSGTSDIRTRSFYVNDTWRLNNQLSMNLGLRYDKNHAVDPLGVVTSNDSAFSPRLSANFDPTGNGKLRVTASYAKYVTALQDTQATGASAGGSPADFWWYFDKTGAPSINTDPDEAARLRARRRRAGLHLAHGPRLLPGPARRGLQDADRRGKVLRRLDPAPRLSRVSLRAGVRDRLLREHRREGQLPGRRRPPRVQELLRPQA